MAERYQQTNPAYINGWNVNGPPPYSISEIPHTSPVFRLQQQHQEAINPSPLNASSPQACYLVPADEFYVVPKFVLFHAKITRGIAIAQLVLGCVAFIFDLIASIIGTNLYFYSTFYTGVYSGIFFILAGTFGLVAAKKGSKCYLITSMVFSILSCAFVIVCLTMLSIQISMNSDNAYNYNYNSFYYYNAQMQPIVGLSAIALIASIIEGFIAIVQSAYACIDCCPCSRKKRLQARSKIDQSQQPQIIYVQGGLGLIKPAPPVFNLQPAFEIQQLPEAPELVPNLSSEQVYGE